MTCTDRRQITCSFRTPRSLHLVLLLGLLFTPSKPLSSPPGSVISDHHTGTTPVDGPATHHRPARSRFRPVDSAAPSPHNGHNRPRIQPLQRRWGLNYQVNIPAIAIRTATPFESFIFDGALFVVAVGVGPPELV